MKKLAKLTASFAVLAALTGCSGMGQKEAPPCPRISVLADASKMTKFRAGPGRDLTDVEVTAEVQSYKGYCAYDSKSGEMSVAIQVGLNVERGPAAQGRTVSIPYFVAIPHYYPKPEAKRTIDMTLTFPDGVNGVRALDDELYITFPIRDFDQLDSYEIFIGLQLDQAQLDYNRESREKR